MNNENKSRFTENELELIRNTFKNNESLLKLIRKFFLPPIDHDAPMGFLVDVYGSIPADGLPDSQVATMVRARNQLVNHLNRMFVELEILANQGNETPKEREVRLKKDSVK